MYKITFVREEGENLVKWKKNGRARFITVLRITKS